MLLSVSTTSEEDEAQFPLWPAQESRTPIFLTRAKPGTPRPPPFFPTRIRFTAQPLPDTFEH